MPIYKMDGKKDGLQKYRVRVNFTNAQGKADSVERVAYGYEDAKNLEFELANKIKKSSPSARMTIGELYKEYIDWQKHRVRETTLKKNTEIMANHVLPLLGDVRLDKFNLEKAREWKLYIEAKPLGVTMKKNILRSLKALMNYAVRFERTPSHPLGKLDNFTDAYAAKKEMDFYTIDEFRRFIEIAKEEAEKKNTLYEWNYYVFFNIAFFCGLRKGEIHALKWTDREGDVLYIRRSITQKLKGEDRETPPKNHASNRDVKMPKQLVQILDEHYKRYSKADCFYDEWRICGGLQPLRDTTIDSRKKEYAEKAGVKNIRMHDFRHSHASLLAHEGINIQEIARRLGHADIEQTLNTYSHLYPDEADRAVEVLNNI